jgi:serine phosphatase RsbU (regulator of sigma subunit)
MFTDGVVEAAGDGGRFGEARLRAELAGAGNPAGTVQRVEGALRSFTAGSLEDDVAILAVSRAAISEAAEVAIPGFSGNGDG